MTRCNVTVNVFFGLANNGGDVFTIEDDTHGLIEDDSSLIGGDTGTAIEGDTTEIHIQRGRNRELDDFDPGVCEVRLNNHDRTYDNTNAASALYGNITPGKRFSVTLWGQQVFGGQVEDWDNEWSVDRDATASFVGVDGLGELGMREYDAWTSTGSQTAGDRLHDALDRSEVNYGIARNFDAGVTSLQSDEISWGSNVLNYCQLVAKSDSGRLFCTRENVLRYQDRLSLVNPDSGIAFRDDGTGVRFHGIITTNGSDLLYNRVGVDREGGTLQTVEDIDSQQAIGIRSLSLSELLMDTDDDANSLAGWLLGLYRDTTTRISSIMVKLNDDHISGANRGAVTALDIGDVVTVSWTPQRVGAPLEQMLVVEGVEHQVDRYGTHVMWIHTSIAQQVGVFVIEDDVYGLIETGGVLAY